MKQKDKDKDILEGWRDRFDTLLGRVEAEACSLDFSAEDLENAENELESFMNQLLAAKDAEQNKLKMDTIIRIADSNYKQGVYDTLTFCKIAGPERSRIKAKLFNKLSTKRGS